MKDVGQDDLADWDPERPWPIRLTDAQRLDWLRLIRSERIGPAAFRSLFNRYGSAADALAALPDLARRGGAKRVPRICSVEAAARELEDASRRGIALIAPGEADYPPAMRHMPAPPPLLSVLGRPTVLRRQAIAIVGPRNASAMGLKFAGLVAHALGEAGLVIASGLARGIDGAAHAASVPTGTVAALAGGLDRVYPPEHVDLAARIQATGALISEMPLGHAPRAKDFPRRNRLIAGMALGTIVVQAAERSGSLITARLASEMGREVFAVPGFPLDARAAGTNRLIRGGATLVTCAQDVLDALEPQLRVTPHQDGPAIAEAIPQQRLVAPQEPDATLIGRVVSALGGEAVEIDDLVRMLDASPGEVRAALLDLELAGRIERQGAHGVALRGR